MSPTLAAERDYDPNPYLRRHRSFYESNMAALPSLINPLNDATESVYSGDISGVTMDTSWVGSTVHTNVSSESHVCVMDTIYERRGSRRAKCYRVRIASNVSCDWWSQIAFAFTYTLG